MASPARSPQRHPLSPKSTAFCLLGMLLCFAVSCSDWSDCFSTGLLNAVVVTSRGSFSNADNLVSYAAPNITSLACSSCSLSSTGLSLAGCPRVPSGVLLTVIGSNFVSNSSRKRARSYGLIRARPTPRCWSEDPSARCTPTRTRRTATHAWFAHCRLGSCDALFPVR